MHTLVIDQLSKFYAGRRAIEDISFSVRSNSIHGLLGPNGAGKSTTMKIMAGLLMPTSGDVRVGSYSILSDLMAIKRVMGLLPENPPLYLDMDVSDYVDFVARLHGLKGNERKTHVRRSLDQSGLGEVRHRLIGNLSKGYRQRVGIAQALVARPDILILDEPTNGLDPASIAEVRSLIRELARDHTILLSSHLLHEMELVCSDLTILHQGRLVATGSLDSIRRNLQTRQWIRLEVDRWDSSLSSELKNVAGVKDVEADHLVVRVALGTSDDMRAEIGRWIVDHQVGLMAMQEEKVELETLFFELTRESEGGRP